MQLKKTVASLAAVSSAAAQRPTNTSICDYYTGALLNENTAANQLTLLTLVVNTAVIGNYTTPNVGIEVPGILNPAGEFNGTKVNLVPYFNGGLESTNRGGSAGKAVNFLDGGGAEPLKNNKPADDENTNQYRLLTHLYSYFGALLGCSLQGETDFPAYAGEASQGSVHRFMDLDAYQLGYFITQVGLSAASFGVATEDVTAVGEALAMLFASKCSPPTTVIPDQGEELQSICQDDTCPMDPLGDQAICERYMSGDEPLVANVTLAMGEGRNGTSSSSGTTAPSSTGSGVATASTAAAAHITGQAALLGAALLALAL